MASQCEVPVFGSDTTKLNAWMLEAVAEGNIWLRAQKPTQEWDAIKDVLGPLYGGGGAGSGIVQGSNTGYNKVRHLFGELRATMSNFRHAGEFVPTENDAQEFFDRAHMLTNLDEHWERTTFANVPLRDALGYGLATGTGYLYQDYDKSRWGPGRGDIRLRAWAPEDVTFVQMPRTYDIQQAYITLIKETLPLSTAKRMYYGMNPTWAEGLVADGDAFGWIEKGKQRVQQFLSIALQNSGSTRKANDSSPTVDIWHAYINDGSVNTSGGPVKMGALNTNWSYTVPTLGDPIPQGVINPRTNQEWTLPAGPDDCLLFPLRRLMIFSRTGVGYDGSSPWWHGATPLARIRFNDLPWEALGASQIGDARTMQIGIVELMRIIENSAAVRMKPPLLYDDQRVDKAYAQAFDTSMAGVTAAADLTLGSPLLFPVDPHYYDVPPWISGEGGYIRQQEERMDYVTSARDMVAIAKARQIPSADTLEKLLEMAGPIVQDMVSALIKPLTELGNWRLAMYFQFYTREKMLRIADPDGAELFKNVKYLPEKLVPYNSGETPEAKAARTQAYLGDFRYDVTESGVSEMYRMSRLLMMIQLNKSASCPISPWTFAKAAKIGNYGPPPAGTNTEMERVVAWQNMQAEQQIELAQKLGQAQMAAQGGAPGAPPPPAGAGEGATGTGEGAGRPASFNAPPKLVQKDGGTRSTITTSR